MNPLGGEGIPTITQCYEILKETNTLPHIKGHSETVMRVAKEIGERLCEAGKNIDLELVIVAALLHDVTKSRSLETGEDHSRTGAELLCEKGFMAVSEIIRQHVRIDGTRNKKITEAEIVNYADKRVIDRNIVSLQERREYIFKRYAGRFDDVDELEKIWEGIKRIETKIFRSMPYGPNRLADKIGN